MKTMILAAVAASLVAAPATAAAPQYQNHQKQQHQKQQQRSSTVVRHAPGKTVVTQRYVQRGPQKAQYRQNWRKGERFDYRQARNYRPVNNWQQYRGRHLYAPPRGYHWVQSGNDAVLVAVAGGLIGAVLAGAFN
jgi:Ni/Co efflux regulator RcnB